MHPGCLLPCCVLPNCLWNCCKEQIPVSTKWGDGSIGNEYVKQHVSTSVEWQPAIQGVAHVHGHHSDAHCSKAFLLRSNLTDTLFILFLYNNDFEGDLSVVSGANLGVVSTADNPKLCGMVPASVRWAHGYNPHNTSLGMPCA